MAVVGRVSASRTSRAARSGWWSSVVLSRTASFDLLWPLILTVASVATVSKLVHLSLFGAAM